MLKNYHKILYPYKMYKISRAFRIEFLLKYFDFYLETMIKY